MRHLALLAVVLWLTLSSSASRAATSAAIATSGNFICHGGHPKCSMPPGRHLYHQFAMRPLLDFAGYSDLLPAGPALEHYQAFMAELDSNRADTNAVAFWSDAMARVDKARVWGAFASARSQLPQGSDAQLIGLEIDVLNAGLPGVFPNQAKVGLQIVGFGATNSNAIEILPQSPESGRFMNLFMADANAVAEDGTIFGIAPQNASTGLNLLGSHFKDAAVLLSPEAAITFRSDGNGDARIYRDSIGAGHLVMNAGPDGLRITDVTNSKNLLNLSPKGWIRSDSQLFINYAPLVYGFGAALVLSLALNVFVLLALRRVSRLGRQLDATDIPA